MPEILYPTCPYCGGLPTDERPLVQAPAFAAGPSWYHQACADRAAGLAALEDAFASDDDGWENLATDLDR
jgi:hypothetical protein